jgi:hypothetical protein
MRFNNKIQGKNHGVYTWCCTCSVPWQTVVNTCHHSCGVQTGVVLAGAGVVLAGAGVVLAGAGVVCEKLPVVWSMLHPNRGKQCDRWRMVVWKQVPLNLQGYCYEPDLGCNDSEALPETAYSTPWMVEVQHRHTCVCCYGADRLGFSYMKSMRAAPPNTSCPGFRWREDLRCTREVFHGGHKASCCEVDNQITVTPSATSYFTVWLMEQRWYRK